MDPVNNNHVTPPAPSASSSHAEATPPAAEHAAGTPAHVPGAFETKPASEAPKAAGGSALPSEESVKPAMDALSAEIDEAMAALGFGDEQPGKQGGGHKGKGGQHHGGMHDVAPIGGPAKAALKGPRVVQAGREHRQGLVVSVGPSDIFIEFGPKQLGVTARGQWPEDELPQVGSQIEVVVDKFESSEGLYVCSRPGAVVKAAWEGLEVGQVVEAKVVGTNKGGLDCEVAGHRAFMPASQVSLDRIPDLSVMIGEKLTCQVSQLDRRGKGNIVLSRRDLLAQERKAHASKLRDTLKLNDTVDGTVRKIMPFGAFVDIGGIDGLVHISDLTYDRVGFGENAIAKHVKEGQKVRVKVLSLEWNDEDIRKSRVSLGIKQLSADPFATATQEVTEGAEVTGRVTRLADFGAFIEIAPGVEGLVHVSEIAYRRINTPADVLKADEIVKAKVLKLDPQNRRISLSIKATQPAPEAPAGGGGRGGKDKAGGGGRTVEEIAAETPQLRRMREQAKLKQKKGLKGGFGKGYNDGGGLAGLTLGQ